MQPAATYTKPTIIQIETHGSPDKGFLSAMSGYDEIPFAIKRIFWIYGVPAASERGQHAHRKATILLVALQEAVQVRCESANGQVSVHQLDSPSQALLIPPMHWHTLHISNPNTLVLCLSSEEYDEAAYLRDYQEFKQIKA